MWSAGLDGANDWLSPSWNHQTGRSAAELQGDGWLHSVHPEDVERCRGIRAASFQAASPFALDYRLRRHDGEYRWMLDNGAPRFAADGSVAGYIGSCVDIHERKALEESLAERAQQLRLAERRQGHFLAMLSHELRNPLAPIANAASVLRTLEHTSPLLVRLRQILDRQVLRLTQLIEELIDVTRAAQGQISLVREHVSVDGFVQAAVADCAAKVTAGGHRLEIDLPEHRLFVRGDHARLAQALGNLVVNAAKFTPQPSVISIGVRQAARTVQVTVKDTGQGIDPQFLPHAFELFAQQSDSLARTLGGLGVGLTLAKRIAQMHGGDIEGYSEGPSLGSEFILWLPLDEAGAEASPAGVGRLRVAESARVLIVEDNADALESLRLQMELWGTEVRTARNAEEALQQAATFQPQIVMCDIGLPGVDGYALVGQLREALSSAPAVYAAVTGYAGADDQERARVAGFDSFFVKPLDAESLARLLHSHAARQT